MKGKVAIGIGIVIAIAMIAIRLVFAHGAGELETELNIISENSRRSYNQFYDELSKVYQRNGGATWEEFVSLYNGLNAIEQVDTVHQLLYLKKVTSYNVYNTDYILCCYEAARTKVKNEEVLADFSEFKDRINNEYSSIRSQLNSSTIDKALSWSKIGECEGHFPNVEIASIRQDVIEDIEQILNRMLLTAYKTELVNDAVQMEFDEQIASALSRTSYSIRSNVKASLGGVAEYLDSEEQVHYVETKTLGNYRYTTTRLKFNQDQFDSKLLDAFNEAYESNSLSTGAKPYYRCFGSYNSCSDWSCSQIKINAGSRDVVTLVKNRSDKVIRHAYIRSYSSYLFDIPNGTYKVIFYSGKGWNPEKVVINNECGPLRGGFVSMPSFTKDENLSIYGQIMTYTLSYQTNGNFTPAGSSAQEAF